MDEVIPQSVSQSLMPPPNHGPNGDEAAKGFINNLKNPAFSSGAEEQGEDKEADKGEEKSGGLITNFINLVSPRSTKAGEFTKRKVEDEVEVGAGEIVNGKTDQQDVGCGENGGGVISNLISNFFNPSEEDKEAEKVKDVGNKRLKIDEEEGGGGGGLIGNIVSHLPRSIPGGSIFLQMTK